MDRSAHDLPFPLDRDERLTLVAHTLSGVIAVTDRRVVVASEHHVTLDLPIAAIRRIELDVERGHSATLVVVPHDPRHAPQVLSVPRDQLDAAAKAVAIVADRLGELDPPS